MYGRILRQLRESKGRSQASVARSVGISPAHLAWLESNQRGLYLEDFVLIVEALDEKPGNLLPNDLGEIGYLKPVIDRLASVKPQFLARVASIIGKIVQLTDEVAEATEPSPKKQRGRTSPKASSPARKGRR